MQTLSAMMVIKGIFLFILGFYLAANACDAATWQTVNPAMMEIATIVTVVGILVAFGSWIIYEDAKRNWKG